MSVAPPAAEPQPEPPREPRAAADAVEVVGSRFLVESVLLLAAAAGDERQADRAGQKDQQRRDWTSRSDSLAFNRVRSVVAPTARLPPDRAPRTPERETAPKRAASYRSPPALSRDGAPRAICYRLATPCPRSGSKRASSPSPSPAPRSSRISVHGRRRADRGRGEKRQRQDDAPEDSRAPARARARPCRDPRRLDRELSGEERRRAVGWAGPDLAFYDDFTARENLRFFRRAAGLPADDADLAKRLARVGARTRSPTGASARSRPA